MSLIGRKTTDSDEERTRPVVFIGDEKKEKVQHTSNNIVAKQNEKRGQSELNTNKI